MKISAIVARSETGLIGIGDKIPWHLPNDFKHFKKTTMGKVLIMGRKTFESIGKPLPGRVTIVVTRNSDWRPPNGVLFVWGIDDALDLAQDLINGEEVISDKITSDEIMICGGGQIYEQTRHLWDKIYLTEVYRVNPDIRRDGTFIWWDKDWEKGFDYKTLSRITVDDTHQYGFTIFEMEKIVESDEIISVDNSISEDKKAFREKAVLALLPSIYNIDGTWNLGWDELISAADNLTDKMFPDE